MTDFNCVLLHVENHAASAKFYNERLRSIEVAWGIFAYASSCLR